VVDFFSLTVSVIKLLCSLDRPLGRGVHRTLTKYAARSSAHGILWW